VADVERAIATLPPERRARVVRTGYVADEERRALLSGAEVLAYPSRYEGFGFPVLEAMACGVPVVTYNVSSLPEVAGDGALLLDPPVGPEALAGALKRVLTDAAFRRALVTRGRARARRFDWRDTARATLEAYAGTPA
jgi:glycosyltransferase involved in cell wall biosynthesis